MMLALDFCKGLSLWPGKERTSILNRDSLHMSQNPRASQRDQPRRSLVEAFDKRLGFG